MRNALIEQRANVWEQAKALLDAAEAEGRDLSAEEQVSYDKMTADLDGLSARIKRAEDAEAREADIRASMGSLPVQEARQEVTDRDRIVEFIKNENQRSLYLPLERRDLVKGTATAGGNLVTTSFASQLYEHAIENAVVASISSVMNTDGGGVHEVPVTTSYPTAALTAEATAITESDPAFGKRSLGAYAYKTMVQVSSELAADESYNLTDFLARRCGVAVGNAFGADLAVGNGSNKPAGIVGSSTLGVTGATGQSGAFTADNLIDLMFSVIGPYRNRTTTGWLMNDTSLARVRKLKDTTNQYLWQPSLQLGVPDMLLGKPVYTDPNIASVATSARSVLFGDFGTYYTRIAGGVRFERSDEFAFNTDLVTFRCVIRGDGILVDQTGAVKHFVGGSS